MILIYEEPGFITDYIPETNESKDDSDYIFRSHEIKLTYPIFKIFGVLKHTSKIFRELLDICRIRYITFNTFLHQTDRIYTSHKIIVKLYTFNDMFHRYNFLPDKPAIHRQHLDLSDERYFKHYIRFMIAGKTHRYEKKTSN